MSDGYADEAVEIFKDAGSTLATAVMYTAIIAVLKIVLGYGVTWRGLAETLLIIWAISFAVTLAVIYVLGSDALESGETLMARVAAWVGGLGR